jgi:hypothetical protein
MSVIHYGTDELSDALNAAIRGSGDREQMAQALAEASRANVAAYNGHYSDGDAEASTAEEILQSARMKMGAAPGSPRWWGGINCIQGLEYNSDGSATAFIALLQRGALSTLAKYAQEQQEEAQRLYQEKMARAAEHAPKKRTRKAS